MKAKGFQKKLQLNKTTVVNLFGHELQNVQAGKAQPYTEQPSCYVAYDSRCIVCPTPNTCLGTQCSGNCC
jgi:hypothetical protein